MNSLRFTCQHGDNFFLPTDQVTETYQIFLSSNAQHLSPEVLNKIHWCNKCTNYFNKVKEICNFKHFDVLAGLHESTIKVQCQKSGHKFNINYGRKLQNLSCPGCSHEEKEQLKERLRKEDELKNEQNRINQERLFAQAQEHMAEETSNNPNWNSNPNNSSYAGSSQDDNSIMIEQETAINKKAL